MKSKHIHSLLVLAALFCVCIQYGCKTNYLAKEHTFPSPVDTHDKPIQVQDKKDYFIDGLTASNQFNAARMNDFVKINDSTYRVTILPENEPINASPHFAFSLKSAQQRNIDLEIYYGDYKHRYWPKLSRDKFSWRPIDSLLFDTLKAGNLATLKLELNSEPLFVAAQEIKDSEYNLNWVKEIKRKGPYVKENIIGQSKLGRDIHYFEFCESSKEALPAIAIFSRTHPPEVSGYMAMQAFVEELLSDSQLSSHFRQRYRTLVYPMINPDGVDMGHWRHNAGGIDLNRDWAIYRQVENRLVANHLVKLTKEDKNEVVLGIDFHSTQEDVLYTHTSNRVSRIYPFKDLWIEGLEEVLGGHDANEEAYDLNSPISKGWFYLQFDAEAITYEVGDETDRAFLKKKARAAAREMMKLLIMRN